MVGLAFAVAASSFCPLLLLGIWWRRLTWPENLDLNRGDWDPEDRWRT